MEYKLTLLGDNGVGKSALTIQFIKCHFVDEYDPTIEDSYRKQVTTLYGTSLLDILDTANFEGHNTMMQQYHKHSEGFLCVYSQTSRSSFKELYKIIDTIVNVKKQQYADDEILQKPCGIIVGNKNDLVEESEVSISEGEELARKYNFPFISTSAKTRNNVEDAFYILVNEIYKQREAIADRDGLDNNKEISLAEKNLKMCKGTIFKLLKKKKKTQVSLNECRASYWNEEEVAYWLDSIGLPNYKEKFLENAINGCELLFLSKEDFSELEVSSSHRKILLKKIEKLKRDEQNQRVRQLIVIEKYRVGKSFTV